MENALWTYPEWSSLLVSGAAWIVLTIMTLGGTWRLQSAQATALALWLSQLSLWLVMVLAMMLPLARWSLRKTAERTLWRRRDRAIGVFVIGYIAPWALLGAIFAAVVISIAGEHIWHGLPWLAAVGFGVAALWQLTPMRRDASVACYRTMPLAPVGFRADRDCFRFGWNAGTACVLTCWPLMLACVLADHSLPAMVCTTLGTVVERNRYAPRQHVLFTPLVAVALIYAVLSTGG